MRDKRLWDLSYEMTLEREALIERQAAALDRIRTAMKKHYPGGVDMDSDAGLAATTDTFIEVHAHAEKRSFWYCNAMDSVAAALRMRSELPHPFNDDGVKRLVAEIERLRSPKVGAALSLAEAVDAFAKRAETMVPELPHSGLDPKEYEALVAYRAALATMAEKPSAEPAGCSKPEASEKPSPPRAES